MRIIIDVNLRQAIADFATEQPAPTYVGKSQDTQSLDIYFVADGVILDEGTGPAIKYGLIAGTNPNLLVLCTSFSRQLDSSGNVYYLGYPIFNTSNLLAALGTQTSIQCTSEVRYQLTTGEIEHTLDIPITIWRTILSEVISDATTAAFTTPAVNANVTVAIGSTSWLLPTQLITIGTAGIYQVISITDGTHFVAQNTGQAGNAASGTNIPSGSSVVNAPISALTTYPPVSQIELISTRDVASGHAGLNASSQIKGSVVPLDGLTIALNPSNQLSAAAILAYTAANFTTPAANGTVTVTFVSTASLSVEQWVRIPIAGFYSVQSITDATHAVLENEGDPMNAIAGTTITSGAVLLPAQAAAGAGGGAPGQNAYTTLSAGFTVPAVGATVSLTVGSTAWMPSSGYALFIGGAGYYVINSITDATHVVVSNSGSAANQPPGTSIASGATVVGAGPQGATGTSGTGFSAYDALNGSFTMPAVGVNVGIVIANTAWLSANQIIYIASAGYFQIATVVNATNLTITNLNYPGNATAGTVIASGSKVSPGGLQGPQGAGGAGLNAFTTLSANFTQPSVLANVTIAVGTTAWMTANLVIYVAGGGYYTISSISDLTHAVISNNGTSGNASVGATITGSGTQIVAPAGAAGLTGTSAYTTTTANFTQPAAGSNVTVTVGAAAWMVQNQNLYINGGGYYQVVSITDATHVVIQNLGITGSATAGATISSGAGVAASGAQGPVGATGATGATGPAGSGGGGSTTAAPFDPRNGFYLREDFLWYGGASGVTFPSDWGFFAASGGGSCSTQDANTWAGTSITRGQGYLLINTGGATSNAFNGGTLAKGVLGAAYNGIILGLGPFEMAGRIALYNSTLPPTGQGFRLSFGLWQQAAGASNIYQASNPYQCLLMDYSPDNNAGNLRLEYANGNNNVIAPTYANGTGTITPAAFHWWSFKVDTSGTVTMFMDGVLIGTFTGVAPLGVPLIPVLGLQRNTAAATLWQIYFDTIYAYEPYTR